MSNSIKPVEEALHCVECGRQLPEGSTVCPHCSSPSDVSLTEAQGVERLLRRARGQLIFGSMVLPCLFAPLALQNTIRARSELAQSDKQDAALSSSITRIQVAALLATVLAFGLVLLWVLGAW
jgi:hypothetical protein